MPKSTVNFVRALLITIPFAYAILLWGSPIQEYIALILPTAICFGFATLIGILQSIDEKLGR